MNLFYTKTEAWNLPLSQAQHEQFARYAAELVAWNSHTNLTAITDAEGITVRHFLDSLACAQVWNEPDSLIDIGTGAGFPGLPLKILRPAMHLTLVESIEKKAAFLRHVVQVLGLNGVTVVVARAEQVGQDEQHREAYDMATARAVADMRVLAEYCLPLCRLGGIFVAPKGGNSEQELQQAEPAIRRLGGGPMRVESVNLPTVDPRVLVRIDKRIPTPPIYPRAIGVPSKRPLT